VANRAELHAAGRDQPTAERLYRRAIAGLERLFGEEHADTLSALNNLAGLYQDRGELAAAEPILVRVLEASERTVGADHPDTLTSLNNLAALYWRMGRLDRSVPRFEDALKRTRAKLGDDHPDTLHTAANLGVNYRDAGRAAEAIPLLEEAHRGVRRYPQLGWVTTNLLDAYTRAGRREEASRLVRQQVAAARKGLKPDSADLGNALASNGRVLLDLGDFAGAEAALRDSVTIREKLAPRAWTTANAKSLLGGALLGQGKVADAEPLLLAGYDGLTAAGPLPPQARDNPAAAADRLIRLYAGWEKPAEVAKWTAERAKHPRETLPPPRRE
jgi:tetratricopeptide (TPR) repeat protein